MEDLNLVMRERLLKAQELEQAQIPLFPNGYPVAHQIERIITEHGGKSAEELEQNPQAFVIAGRILAIRTFGKSIFMHILDVRGKLQIYLQQNQVGQDAYALMSGLHGGSKAPAAHSDFTGSSSTIRRVASGPRNRDTTHHARPLRPLPWANPALISPNVNQPTAYCVGTDPA